MSCLCKSGDRQCWEQYDTLDGDGERETILLITLWEYSYVTNMPHLHTISKEFLQNLTALNYLCVKDLDFAPCHTISISIEDVLLIVISRCFSYVYASPSLNLTHTLHHIAAKGRQTLSTVYG